MQTKGESTRHSMTEDTICRGLLRGVQGLHQTDIHAAMENLPFNAATKVRLIRRMLAMLQEELGVAPSPALPLQSVNNPPDQPRGRA